MNLFALLSYFILFAKGLAELEFKVSSLTDGANIELKKTEKHIGREIGEDFFVSTPKGLVVSDGVGGCNFSSAFLSAILATVAANFFAGPLFASFKPKANIKPFLMDKINQELEVYNSKLLRAFKSSSVSMPEKEDSEILRLYETKATFLAASLTSDPEAPANTARLKIFQKGDSLIAVFRQRKTPSDPSKFFYELVFLSKEHVGDFNAPFGIYNQHNIKYPALEAELADFSVRPMDLVVLGTDGLFDNVSANLLLLCVNALAYLSGHKMAGTDELEAMVKTLAKKYLNKMEWEQSSLKEYFDKEQWRNDKGGHPRAQVISRLQEARNNRVSSRESSRERSRASLRESRSPLSNSRSSPFESSLRESSLSKILSKFNSGQKTRQESPRSPLKKATTLNSFNLKNSSQKINLPNNSLNISPRNGNESLSPPRKIKSIPIMASKEKFEISPKQNASPVTQRKNELVQNKESANRKAHDFKLFNKKNTSQNSKDPHIFRPSKEKFDFSPINKSINQSPKNLSFEQSSRGDVSNILQIRREEAKKHKLQAQKDQSPSPFPQTAGSLARTRGFTDLNVALNQESIQGPKIPKSEAFDYQNAILKHYESTESKIILKPSSHSLTESSYSPKKDRFLKQSPPFVIQPHPSKSNLKERFSPIVQNSDKFFNVYKAQNLKASPKNSQNSPVNQHQKPKISEQNLIQSNSGLNFTFGMRKNRILAETPKGQKSSAFPSKTTKVFQLGKNTEVPAPKGIDELADLVFRCPAASWTWKSQTYFESSELTHACVQEAVEDSFGLSAPQLTEFQAKFDPKIFSKALATLAKTLAVHKGIYFSPFYVSAQKNQPKKTEIFAHGKDDDVTIVAGLIVKKDESEIEDYSFEENILKLKDAIYSDLKKAVRTYKEFLASEEVRPQKEKQCDCGSKSNQKEFFERI